MQKHTNKYDPAIQYVLQGQKWLDNTVALLRRLKLHKIPKRWVTSIWDSQFTDNPALDAFEGKH